MHTLPTPKGANRKSKIPIGKGLQLRTKVVLGVVSYPTGMSHPSSPKNEFSGSKPIAHQRFPAKRSKTRARQRAREADVKCSAALLRQRSQSFTTFTVPPSKFGERERAPLKVSSTWKVLQTRNGVEENQSSDNLPPKLEKGIFVVKSGQIKGSCDDVFAKKGVCMGGVPFLFSCWGRYKPKQDLGSSIRNLWGIHTPKGIH